MKIEFDEVCQSCKGTGLYVGMGERDGAAVVCHTCKGTGCNHFVHDYEPFERRKVPPIGVRRVFEVNPGIGLGEGNGHTLSEFGGMPLKEWEAGFDFPHMSENRKFTCPAWWYQSADYEKKPNWKECGFGSFTDCKCFPTKNKCWEKWDKRYGDKT